MRFFGALLPCAGAYVCGPVQNGVVIGSGFDIATYHNETSSNCCGLCGNTDGCKAWNFHTSPDSPFYNQCHLHSSDAKSTNSSDSLAGLVTGAQGCSYFRGGFWGSGDNVGIVTHVTNAPACCANCKGNPKCKAWVWHDEGSGTGDDHTCWLHGSIGNFEYSSSTYGGIPGNGPLPPKPAKPGQYVHGFACRDADASEKYKFCDESLPMSVRLDDLVPRITDDEVGSQLTARQSPNISRIGLPSYCESRSSRLGHLLSRLL